MYISTFFKSQNWIHQEHGITFITLKLFSASEAISEERREIEPLLTDPIDLGKGRSNINDNLQVMSKLKLKLAVQIRSSMHRALEDTDIPLDKAVADLIMQFKDFRYPSDAQGLLNALTQAL